MLLVAVWVALRGGTLLFSAPAAQVAWQALWQGVFAGALGL